MSLPPDYIKPDYGELDYVERVYDGVLGKIIGVYLGRPFEGWSYERIMAELGEIQYYMHEKLRLPLVVPDDDISGTFTFLRALPDYGNNLDLTSRQIGQTWLNYIIENRSILWWGGMGNSTEHTAFLRLKNGISAPSSGSAEINGKLVSEQIGAQIFIDGWAMVCPGDPERAVDFTRKAASVSHDGEAIYGAQVIVAMEAQAFIEPDLSRLLDVAVSFIPHGSVIYRLISDLREWRVKDADWHKTRDRIVAHYGYDKYGWNCHIVPNHALIHLGLLYGDDDFQKSLMITNTSGWDTDCNSGNIGCLLGIKNGLASFGHGPDWRGPVADRLYLAAADGGRCITDAVTETYQIANIGRALDGKPPIIPKDGARFHFSLPGSCQGFAVEKDTVGGGSLVLENSINHSRGIDRCLAFRYALLPGQPLGASTPTFPPPDAINRPGYNLMASPTLYPGQVLQAQLSAGDKNLIPVDCQLNISIYSQDDRLEKILGPVVHLVPGESLPLTWCIPQAGGPIAEVGIELTSDVQSEGVIYLDRLGWTGVPETIFTRPAVQKGSMWWKAWVNGMDHVSPSTPEPFRLIQDHGRGLLIQGCREWDNYQVKADISPVVFKAAGLAARVQGMQRFYAFLLCDGSKVRLVKALDGDHILGEMDYPWRAEETYHLSLSVQGNRIQAFIEERRLFDVVDTDRPLTGGAIALVCEEGCFTTQAVTISGL